MLRAGPPLMRLSTGKILAHPTATSAALELLYPRALDAEETSCADCTKATGTLPSANIAAVQNSLPLSQFPAAGKFLQAYADPAQWKGGLAQWFHYNPHDAQCFVERMEETGSRIDLTQRGQLAAALVTKQERLGSSSAAIRNTRLLSQANTFTVVTGQQAGLFGGPLYSQLKAISAILLARQLAEQFPACKFVPVFWIASGDSDFEEVRRSFVLDKSGEVTAIELPPNGTHWDNELIASRDVGEYMHGALAKLAEALPGGEYRDEVLAQVSEAYGHPHLNESFAVWMSRLFSGSGLVIVEPDLDVRRYGPHTLIRQELEQPQMFAEALSLRDTEIEQAGFPVQVQSPPGDTNVFFLREGRRYKVSYEDGLNLRPRGEDLPLSEELDEGPHNFLPSALLGPVYQDALLRPAAFIGGGAELAYRAQSCALADAHGMKLAPAFMRASATLLPQKSAQTCDELGWQLPDLYRPPEEVIKAAVARDKPEQIAAALEDYLNTLHTADDKLRAVAIELDPSLEETFETLRGNLIRHLEKLDKKITGSLKQRSEARMRKVTALHNQVYPRQQVQERELSLMSFLPRYGFEVVDKLASELKFPCWEHQVVVL
jgi:bacillithiol biosynthesis cysteine-adding enzyme BshC